MAGLSVAFDASCEEMWLAWRSGAALVTAPRHIVRSGPDLGDWIVEQRITAVSTVPTLASLWPAESLDRVRLLIFGGEACPLELIARLDRPGRELWNTYGPTEATVIATGMLMTPEPPVRIGLPICGWQLAVIDPTPPGTRWAGARKANSSSAVFGLGRYLEPEKDAEKYAPLPSLGWDRCYRTGDMVTADRDGLIFAGRIDDQIKLGGQRLELGRGRPVPVRAARSELREPPRCRRPPEVPMCSSATSLRMHPGHSTSTEPAAPSPTSSPPEWHRSLPSSTSCR